MFNKELLTKVLEESAIAKNAYKTNAAVKRLLKDLSMDQNKTDRTHVKNDLRDLARDNELSMDEKIEQATTALMKRPRVAQAAKAKAEADQAAEAEENNKTANIVNFLNELDNIEVIPAEDSQQESGEKSDADKSSESTQDILEPKPDSLEGILSSDNEDQDVPAEKSFIMTHKYKIMTGVALVAIAAAVAYEGKVHNFSHLNKFSDIIMSSEAMKSISSACSSAKDFISAKASNALAMITR